MIDIVIVNWNAGSFIKACIDSINTHNEVKACRIIVVDNGSTDGSDNEIEDLPNVELIRAGQNLGFGAACNLGAKAGSAPYILFLNPDTRLEANSLSAPLSFMEQPCNTNVGVCGIQLIDSQHEVSRHCARYPKMWRLISSMLGMDKLPGLRGTGILMADWDHKDSARIDHVMGAFYLIRRQVFESVGGFDERYFVYLEDVDLSKSVSEAGWAIYYLADVQVFHEGGGTSSQVKTHRLFYSLRSRLLYAFKHFPIWQAWVLLLISAIVEPFSRSIWCLLRGDLKGIRNTFSAYHMLWQAKRNILFGDGRYNP